MQGLRDPNKICYTNLRQVGQGNQHPKWNILVLRREPAYFRIERLEYVVRFDFLETVPLVNLNPYWKDLVSIGSSSKINKFCVDVFAAKGSLN